MDSRQPLPRFIVIAVLIVGAVVGGAAVEYWRSSRLSSPTAAQTNASTASDAEIERLKTLVPSQSHAMFDVGFHWTNLWFAAKQQNWPLAEFYFNEARQHIQWTIRIRPVRKDAEGKDVDLKAIFFAVDTSAFEPVKAAILQKDGAKFTTVYKEALEGCYSCHKASGKPFLRPIIPAAPAPTIIDFAPDTAAATGTR